MPETQKLTRFILTIFCLICWTSCDRSDIGSLELISAATTSLKIKWSVPAIVELRITRFRLMTSKVSAESGRWARDSYVDSRVNIYEFVGLEGNTTYRVSVEGFQGNKSVSYTSSLFTTSLAALDWLPAPTDLGIIEKTDHSMDVAWRTPVLAQANLQAQINQHSITYCQFDMKTRQTLKPITRNIAMPTTRARIAHLAAAAVYNITVQAGTDNGYGQLSWCAFSTLEKGQEHTVRLKARTPTTLTVKCNPRRSIPLGYKLIAETIHTSLNENETRIVELDANSQQSALKVLPDLTPGATYNISVVPVSGQTQIAAVWSVYSTLPLGHFVATDLRLTDETDVAASLSWQPIEHQSFIQYQVRYLPNDGGEGTVESPTTIDQLLCPTFGCNRFCYLVYNLRRNPQDFAFQVRAQVSNVWNKWVTAVRRPWNVAELKCSIVPPENHIRIDDWSTLRNISFGNSTIDLDIWRYEVVVDSRLATKGLDRSKLADKRTADTHNLNYYVTGSFPSSSDRLLANASLDQQQFSIGDGRVYGGYVNYPLKEDDKFRWYLIEAKVSAAQDSTLSVTTPTTTPLLTTTTAYRPCPLISRTLFGGCQRGDWYRSVPVWYIGVVALLIVLIVLCSCFFCCTLCCYFQKRRKLIYRRASTSEMQRLNFETMTDKGNYDTAEYDKNAYCINDLLTTEDKL